MRIAISNLSWSPNEDQEILSILRKYQIKGVEIAPTKIWPVPTQTSESDLKKYQKFWLDNGISIIATTSLLFGHPELVLFGDEKTRVKTLEYLSEMIRVSASFGAKAMVFGSPKNRHTNGLQKKEVDNIAQDFFYKIGEIAKKYNLYFGIEPNPVYYNTDFINTTDEAIQLVRVVSHPNFRLHMDSGAMTMNNEDYQETIKNGLPFTYHFHISEPMLKPVPQEGSDHQTIAAALKKMAYDKYVSVEMPLIPEIDHITQIDQTLKFVTQVYG